MTDLNKLAQTILGIYKTEDICETCHVPLRHSGTESIWVAGGLLYCSERCGRLGYGLPDSLTFEDVAEEINLSDIGIVPTSTYTAKNGGESNV